MKSDLIVERIENGYVVSLSDGDRKCRRYYRSLEEVVHSNIIVGIRDIEEMHKHHDFCGVQNRFKFSFETV